MPTVVELRAIIKKHQAKNCEKTSKMKKAELLEVVSRINRVRNQRELGVDVIKKKKALQKSLVLKDGKNKSISKITALTAPGKSFTSKGSISPARMSFAELQQNIIRISERDKKANQKMSFAELQRHVLRISARDKKITPAENKKYNSIIASAPKAWQDLVKRILAALTASQKNDFKVKIASIKMSLVINYIQSVAEWALSSADTARAIKARAAEKSPPKKRGESKQNVTKSHKKRIKNIKAQAATINARYDAKLRSMSPTEQAKVRKIQGKLTKERRIDFKIGIADTESAAELEEFLRVMRLR